MPASGKSHWGRLLAEAWDWPFWDSDAWIEAKMSCSIAEIFEIWGEGFFRELEHRFLYDFLSLQQKPYVLATGGGLIAQKGHLAWLKQRAYLIHLQPSIEVLAQRIRTHQAQRPMFAAAKSLEEIKFILSDLWLKRQTYYEAADYVFEQTPQPNEVWALLGFKSI